MGRSSRRLFALVCLTAAPLLAQVGCTQSEGGAFECLNDGDCPLECPCDNDPLLGDLVGACESKETRRDCGGSCDAETQCSAGTSCVFDRTDGEVDFYSCKGDGTGGAGGMAGTGGTGGTGGSPGCASFGGVRLLMTLEWTGGGNLQIGATTPNAPTNVVAANYNEANADPNCTHSGDEPIQSGLFFESMACVPPMTGTYSMQVDNEEMEDKTFDLLVTIDGVDVPGFPQLGGSLDPNGRRTIDFCIE